MIRRGCERPFFLRIGSIIRGRRIRQEGGGHLVGEAAEVVVDLDLDASEAGGVPGQLIAPLSLLNIDLMGQLRRDVVQGDNKGAGLGSGVDLHRRLVRAAGREEMRLCYRDPEAITTFRKSTLRELYGHDRCGRGAKAGSGEFTTADAALRQSVAATQAQADAELADPKLPTPCQKVLTSLQEHWSGLTRFLDDPQIPLDHKASERRVRGPAVARKNYCGSGASWSGRLAAMLFSLFATLDLAKINVRIWLTWFLRSCAENGGQVPIDIQPFLPWNMSSEQRRERVIASDDSS